jgi:hypothetical protein
VNTARHVIEVVNTPTGPLTTDLVDSAGAVTAASDAWPYRRNDFLNAVVYRGSDNHIHELSQPISSAARWHDTDLTVAAGAGAVTDGDPMAYVRSEDKNAVVYRKEDHIFELSQMGEAWLVRNLSAEVFTSAMARGNPMAYARKDKLNAVVYRDDNNHIRELGSYYTAIGENDLFASTGTTVPAASDPWGYAISKVECAIVYLGSDGAIHELRLNTSDPVAPDSGGWAHSTLPATSPTGRPWGYLRSDNRATVVYRSTSASDDSLRELTLDGTWIDSLLVPLGPANTPAADLFGSRGSGSTTSVLYRTTNNEILQYLQVGAERVQSVSY